MLQCGAKALEEEALEQVDVDVRRPGREPAAWLGQRQAQHPVRVYTAHTKSTEWSRGAEQETA